MRYSDQQLRSLSLFVKERSVSSVFVHRLLCNSLVTIMSSRDKCVTCSKTVYVTERIVAGDSVFHKGCFRCAHCKNTIRLGNYAALDGKYYCKPHFKQLFALKGNYNEGFGTAKHSTKWLNKDSATQTSTPALVEEKISLEKVSLEKVSLEKVSLEKVSLEKPIVGKEKEDTEEEEPEPVPNYFGLTPEEIKDAEEQFKKYDLDQSGTIDREEMYKLLVDVSKGKQSGEVLRKIADMHFKAADKDASGQIDEIEFLQVYSKLLKDPL